MLKDTALYGVIAIDTVDYQVSNSSSERTFINDWSLLIVWSPKILDYFAWKPKLFVSSMHHLFSKINVSFVCLHFWAADLGNIC